ncbi:hypothetical protein [Listeria grandensis]|uniref:hypothetical protein n=1 Tax=Listeria grandensis TaxID=1494963 RepID=UPI0004BAD5A1|nr:hypothetical protein [Listeria grandensis]
MKSQIRKYYSEDKIVFCEDFKNERPEPECDLIFSDYPITTAGDTDVLVCHMPPSRRDFLQLREFVHSKKRKG